MTKCECVIAGFCERHKITKSDHWHRLCQEHENYFQAWEQGTGPGQNHISNPNREARRIAVQEAVRLKKELVEWLRTQRIDGEKGIGDTATRLVTEPIKQKERILRLIKQASCRTCDAITKLNQQYPY